MLVNDLLSLVGTVIEILICCLLDDEQVSESTTMPDRRASTPPTPAAGLLSTLVDISIVITIVMLLSGQCCAVITGGGGGGGGGGVGEHGVCPAKCECKWRGGKESVSCHNAGLVEIPKRLEPTVQVVDLSGNPLGQLSSQIFRRLELVHLQRILMARCSLKQIDRSAFNGLTNLIDLDLSNNLLTSVPSHALESIPQLRELKLNGNPLIRLNNHALAAVSQLVRLEMANCQLKALEARAFHGLELLEWLRLEGNLIENLQVATLGSLRSLRGVDLHHNPWDCTCSLRPVRSWLAARNMPFSVPPLCISPGRLRGQSWNRIAMDELACPATVQAAQAVVQVHSGEAATMTCHVQSDPEASVTWFFADRLITNMSHSSITSNRLSDGVVQVERQVQDMQQTVYYIRESGTTEKTSHLELSSVRQHDSGVYFCWAANKSGKVSANVTLVVKGVVGAASSEGATWNRGLVGGLLLAAFIVLIVLLLFCCFCSLKRARGDANLLNRRASMCGANSAMMPTQYEKVELVSEFDAGSATTPGAAYPATSNSQQRFDFNNDQHMANMKLRKSSLEQQQQHRSAAVDVDSCKSAPKTNFQRNSMNHYNNGADHDDHDRLGELARRDHERQKLISNHDSFESLTSPLPHQQHVQHQNNQRMARSATNSSLNLREIISPTDSHRPIAMYANKVIFCPKNHQLPTTGVVGGVAGGGYARERITSPGNNSGVGGESSVASPYRDFDGGANEFNDSDTMDEMGPVMDDDGPIDLCQPRNTSRNSGRSARQQYAPAVFGGGGGKHGGVAGGQDLIFSPHDPGPREAATSSLHRRQQSVPSAPFPSSAASSASSNNRRRYSDWEINELINDCDPMAADYSPLAVNEDYYLNDSEYDNEDNPTRHRLYSYLDCSDAGDPNFDTTLTTPGRRHRDHDYHRRYAYHSSQLNRFLSEYRTLQKRLARMQETCGRWGLSVDDNANAPGVATPAAVATPSTLRSSANNISAAVPLRPILKNRPTQTSSSAAASMASSASATKRWTSLEYEDSSPSQNKSRFDTIDHYFS